MEWIIQGNKSGQPTTITVVSSSEQTAIQEAERRGIAVVSIRDASLSEPLNDESFRAAILQEVRSIRSWVTFGGILLLLSALLSVAMAILHIL